MPVAATPDISPVSPTVSDTTLDSVLAAIREPAQEPSIPEPLPTEPVILAPIVSPVVEPEKPLIQTEIPLPAVSSPISSVSVATPVADILAPLSPKIEEKIDTQPAEKIPEQPIAASTVPPAVPVSQPTISPTDAEKLRRYMEEDVIYHSMLRVVDEEQIRLRLALRYMIMMFAVFLVAAWVVNNRVIMFGFSEFQILARIRDALFGMIAGLFSLTIWFGSDVWFRSKYMIIIMRIIASAFFGAVLSALYFPLW